ncbi:hypothetical protein [Micromonospora sp. NPDC049240]
MRFFWIRNKKAIGLGFVYDWQMRVATVHLGPFTWDIEFPQ